MKRSALTTDEILARIQAEEQVAYGINDAELSGERAEAIDYYLGRPFGNEVPGRSQVISTDVADTIESILPQLLKVFMSGDEVVRFDPKGPEDIDASEQETEVINHIVLEKNHGFSAIYTWFKDALLSKNGYLKVYWCEETEVEKEFYQGLTDDELALLLQGDVEVTEHTVYPDEIDAQQRQEALAQLAPIAQQDPNAAAQMQQIMSQPEKMLHDVRIEITESKGKIEIEPVAPEAMMISVDNNCVSVQEARFVQHREEMSIAELREEGYEVSDDIGFDSDNDWLEEESNARDIYGEEFDRGVTNGADRLVLVKDTYLRINGELKRYVVVGNTIILEEDCEVIPFAVITPVIMPHRHIGRSVADLVSDIQLIKSTLMRGQLDGMYLALNPRHVVSERVNLDDMLTSRPGGVVRVQGDVGTAMMPLITPDVSGIAYPMMEYMDTVKENRTGVTKYNQGLDANSLNKTASGITQIMSAAQERVNLIARIFAETGVKELFYLTHRLMKMHSQRDLTIQLRNKWVTVDPRQWKSRTDMSVSVGLGTGNKDQMLAHLMTIVQAQKEGLQIGLATPKNIYNALAKLTQNAGFKNPEEFWTNPEMNQQPKEPPQPSPDTVLLSQTEIKKAEIAAETAKDKARLDAEVKITLEREKMQLDAQKTIIETSAKEQQMQADAVSGLVDNLMTQRQTVKQALDQREPSDDQIEKEQEDAKTEVLMSALMAMTSAIENMNMAVSQMGRPKQIVRDDKGRAVGIQ